MPARRCSLCGLNWPAKAQLHCPVCEGDLHYMSNETAMSAEESRRLRAYSEFQRWLADETPDQRRDRQERYAAQEARREAEFQKLVSQLDSE